MMNDMQRRLGDLNATLSHVESQVGCATVPGNRQRGVDEVLENMQRSLEEAERTITARGTAGGPKTLGGPEENARERGERRGGRDKTAAGDASLGDEGRFAPAERTIEAPSNVGPPSSNSGEANKAVSRLDMVETELIETYARLQIQLEETAAHQRALKQAEHENQELRMQLRQLDHDDDANRELRQVHLMDQLEFDLTAGLQNQLKEERDAHANTMHELEGYKMRASDLERQLSLAPTEEDHHLSTEGLQRKLEEALQQKHVSDKALDCKQAEIRHLKRRIEQSATVLAEREHEHIEVDNLLCLHATCEETYESGLEQAKYDALKSILRKERAAKEKLEIDIGTHPRTTRQKEVEHAPKQAQEHGATLGSLHDEVHSTFIDADTRLEIQAQQIRQREIAQDTGDLDGDDAVGGYEKQREDLWQRVRDLHLQDECEATLRSELEKEKVQVLLQLKQQEEHLAEKKLAQSEQRHEVIQNELQHQLELQTEKLRIVIPMAANSERVHNALTQELERVMRTQDEMKAKCQKIRTALDTAGLSILQRGLCGIIREKIRRCFHNFIRAMWTANFAKASKQAKTQQASLSTLERRLKQEQKERANTEREMEINAQDAMAELKQTCSQQSKAAIEMERKMQAIDLKHAEQIKIMEEQILQMQRECELLVHKNNVKEITRRRTDQMEVKRTAEYDIIKHAEQLHLMEEEMKQMQKEHALQVHKLHVEDSTTRRVEERARRELEAEKDASHEANTKITILLAKTETKLADLYQELKAEQRANIDLQNKLSAAHTEAAEIAQQAGERMAAMELETNAPLRKQIAALTATEAELTSKVMREEEARLEQTSRFTAQSETTLLECESRIQAAMMDKVIAEKALKLLEEEGVEVSEKLAQMEQKLTGLMLHVKAEEEKKQELKASLTQHVMQIANLEKDKALLLQQLEAEAIARADAEKDLNRNLHVAMMDKVAAEKATKLLEVKGAEVSEKCVQMEQKLTGLMLHVKTEEEKKQEHINQIANLDAQVIEVKGELAATKLRLQEEVPRLHIELESTRALMKKTTEELQKKAAEQEQLHEEEIAKRLQHAVKHDQLLADEIARRSRAEEELGATKMELSRAAKQREQMIKQRDKTISELQERVSLRDQQIQSEQMQMAGTVAELHQRVFAKNEHTQAEKLQLWRSIEELQAQVASKDERMRDDREQMMREHAQLMRTTAELQEQIASKEQQMKSEEIARVTAEEKVKAVLQEEGERRQLEEARLEAMEGKMFHLLQKVSNNGYI